MNDNIDYTRQLNEIRSMMERSAKFFSLSGWAGILAGTFAIAGAYIAWQVFEFHPTHFHYANGYIEFFNVFLLAMVVLVLAVSAALIDSRRKASRHNQRAWNAVTRKMLTDMAIPLVAGGILMVVLGLNGLIGLSAPLSLLFYGLALYNAGRYTYRAVRTLGLVMVALGLLNCFFMQGGLLFWGAGFGMGHIVYGIYMFRIPQK